MYYQWSWFWRKLNPRLTPHSKVETLIKKGKELYGDSFLVYNVHSLIHLVDDAERLGTLDNFSDFPFENYLQKIKQIVKGGRSPLTQIINFLNLETLVSNNLIIPLTLKLKSPNNCFLLDDNLFCEILPISLSSNINYDTHHRCRLYYRTRPYYKVNSTSILIDSSAIGCFISNISDSHILPINKKKLNLRVF